MPSTAVYYHPRFLDHDTGSHPEAAQRLVACRTALLAGELDLEWLEPLPARPDDIERVHDRVYRERLRLFAEEGGGYLDADTVVSSASYDAALLAAGAGIDAVDRALAGVGPAFLLVRPPGHHALRTRGMGFCLFNNVAVAAAHAVQARGLDRVLIFDWDVHHGNGTQDAFYDDPRVLFISMHQRDHYPGTGHAHEVGSGPGAGYTVNIPLPARAGDGAARLIFESVVEPLARAYRPQLLLVSCGFDSMIGDPLGGLRLSEDAYRWMASRLMALGREVSAVGPVCALEGGYDPEALARAVGATLQGLVPDADVAAVEQSVGLEEAVAVAATVAELAPYWGRVVG